MNRAGQPAADADEDPAGESYATLLDETPAPPGLEAAAYRATLGHFASGVTVITGMDDGGPIGLTCQSFFSLSLEPMLVAVGVGRSSFSWPRIAQTGTFGINVLAEQQEALARDFATRRGDKFVGVSWQPGPSGSPRLAGALAWVECRVAEVVEAGDHLLVVGSVLDFDSAAGQPLLFFRGGFFTGLG